MPKGTVVESRRAKFSIGDRFGRWTVTGEAPPTKWARMLYATCDCGTKAVVSFKNLRKGTSVSCGCFKVENSKAVLTKHGASGGWKGRGTPEYTIWVAMKMRCQNPNAPHWEHYGGRGIRVCDRWRGPDGFSNFLADMGPRPEGKTASGKRAFWSIDRIDNNGNYEPGNCRWADGVTQARNQRKTAVSVETGKRLVDIIDGGATVSQAAGALGLKINTVYSAYTRLRGRHPPFHDKKGPKPRARAA